MCSCCVSACVRCVAARCVSSSHDVCVWPSSGQWCWCGLVWCGPVWSGVIWSGLVCLVRVAPSDGRRPNQLPSEPTPPKLSQPSASRRAAIKLHTSSSRQLWCEVCTVAAHDECHYCYLRLPRLQCARQRGRQYHRMQQFPQRSRSILCTSLLHVSTATTSRRTATDTKQAALPLVTEQAEDDTANTP